MFDEIFESLVTSIYESIELSHITTLTDAQLTNVIQETQTQVRRDFTVTINSITVDLGKQFSYQHVADEVRRIYRLKHPQTAINEFSQLTGHTIISVSVTDDTFTVTLSDGRKFQLYHEQDCCESVYLEDVTGHTDDLLNVPIINAIVTVADDEFTEYGDVCQWTFYHLFTAKGGVTLRWLGSSNGYYSIAVDFREVI